MVTCLALACALYSPLVLAGLDVEEKLADGSAVEVFLARSSSGRVLVQVSRPELGNDIELYARFMDVTRRSKQKRSQPFTAYVPKPTLPSRWPTTRILSISLLLPQMY